MITGRNALIYLAIKNKGDWDAIYRDIKSCVPVDEKEAEKAVSSLSCDAITIVDPIYPESLKNVSHPPFAIFYKGNIELISDTDKCAYIVGTRMPSEDGLHAVREIVRTLNENGYAVISHNARGTDIEALRQAEYPVCVLGNGFDRIYPVGTKKEMDYIAEKGLLISEFPPNVEPQARNFVTNKRIAVALSKAVLCGEVAERSGSLISVSVALNMGKDVGAIPMPYGSKTANNMLISQGATLIAKPQDTLDLLG